MKEIGAGGYTIFLETPNTAGGYADFQFKKYDMKAKVSGGYAFFQETCNPTKHANDICARISKDTGGQAPFLKTNTLETQTL